GTNLVSTLQVIAKDVKIQIDFDPAAVKRYRLIGYENRDIRDEDFSNDKVDAGDNGAGHNATAYYELELDPAFTGSPLANVKVRYKAPDGDTSTEVAKALTKADFKASFEAATPSFRFGAAIAEFAEILRDSPYAEGNRFGDIVGILN